MMDITLSDLENKLNFNTEEEKEMLKKAFEINSFLPKNYQNIDKLTAIDLAQNYGADNNTILATLIYKQIKNVDINEGYVAKLFNANVESKVKILSTFDYNLQSSGDKNKLNFIKSITKDVKVTIIKLVERLNTLRYINRYLGKISLKTQKFINDTLNFYIPVCQLIGVRGLQIELEDICFKTDKNYDIAEEIKDKIKVETDEIIKLIEPTLSEIGASLVQNKRSNYDIFLRSKKLQSKVKELNDFKTIDLLDFCSIKCLVDTYEQCYEALYLIHMFNPIMGHCIDYLPGIQGNEYKAIHTYIFFKSCLVDFRICTRNMDIVNSYGVCSNWNDNIDFNKRLEENYEFYNCLESILQNVDDKDLIEAFKKEILDRQIYQTDEDEVKKMKILNRLKGKL